MRDLVLNGGRIASLWMKLSIFWSPYECTQHSCPCVFPTTHTCTHMHSHMKTEKEKTHNCLLLPINLIRGTIHLRASSVSDMCSTMVVWLQPQLTSFCLLVFYVCIWFQPSKSGPSRLLHSRLNSLKEMALTAGQPSQATSLNNSTLLILEPLLPSVACGSSVHSYYFLACFMELIPQWFLRKVYPNSEVCEILKSVILFWEDYV